MDSPRISLTRAQVLEMRSRYAQGGETFSSLAKEFGVTVTTASNAIQGLKAYKDLS